MKTPLTTLAMAALLSLGPGTSSAAAADAPDAWITAKTRIALMTTEGIDSWDLDVDTNGGVVTLHGKVETAAAKAVLRGGRRGRGLRMPLMLPQPALMRPIVIEPDVDRLSHFL